MLIKAWEILYIIATYYYIECLEPKDSRKFDQPAMPPAYEIINNYDYEFDSMPIYSTPNPIIQTAAERIAIQYAPIEMTDSNNNKHTHAPNRTEPTLIFKEHKNQELEEKNFLQPEYTSQMIDRNQKTRSFFSGHDISLQQSSSNVGTHDLYRTYHNHVDQSKIRSGVYTSFQNSRQGTPEEELLPDGRTVLYLPGSGQIIPLQEKKYIRKLVPFVLTKPFSHGALARSQGGKQKPYLPKKSSQNLSSMTPRAIVQGLSALSPELHLNLARVYGIAHVDDQRHINLPHHRKRPSIMSKKSVDKKKIFLHPLPYTTQPTEAKYIQR